MAQNGKNWGIKGQSKDLKMGDNSKSQIIV